MSNSPESINGWMKKPQEYLKFAQKAAACLMDRRILDEEYCTIDDGNPAIPLRNWIAEFSQKHPTATIEDACTTLDLIMDKTPFSLGRIGGVSFSQTFSVPGGSVTFSHSISCEVTGYKRMETAYGYCQAKVINAYNDYLRSQGGQAAMKQSGEQAQAKAPLATAAGTATQTASFTKIIKNVDKKGDTAYNFVGGAWTQYGVRLYPEAIKPAHKEFLEALPFGAHAYSGTMEVFVKDGKAVRVSSIKFDKA